MIARKEPALALQPLHCGCCQAHTTTPLCTLRDDADVPVALYLCADCGALTPNYTLEQQQENTQRQTRYYENKWAEETEAQSDQLAVAMTDVVKFYREYGFLPSADKAPVVVDIGAGRGALLSALQREGYAPVGAEPAEGLVARAYHYYGMDTTVLQCMTAEAFVAQLTATGQKVDAAFLWHVIEHVKQPARLLTAIAATLTDQGVIILQAPLPLPSSIFPEHLYLLNRQTVFSLAAMSGLTVCFCDVSHRDQFISFVLGKPDSDWPKLAPPDDNVLDVWITDLHDGLASLNEIAYWQRKLIEERFITMEQQDMVLTSPWRLFKRLVRLLLTRKTYG